MEWLGPVLTALIGKFDVITLMSLILIGGCGWCHIVWRREDREDRAKFLDAFNKNSDALASLKNVISAATGKAL